MDVNGSEPEILCPLVLHSLWFCLCRTLRIHLILDCNYNNNIINNKDLQFNCKILDPVYQSHRTFMMKQKLSWKKKIKLRTS